jgi:hypothetical protein
MVSFANGLELPPFELEPPCEELLPILTKELEEDYNPTQHKHQPISQPVKAEKALLGTPA